MSEATRDGVSNKKNLLRCDLLRSSHTRWFAKLATFAPPYLNDPCRCA
jgi:hypothetical protein